MTSTDSRRGVLRRLADRLVHQGEHREAGSPARERPAPQHTPAPQPIGGIEERTRVTVVGELRSVTIRPREDVPALVAELADATGSVLLVWLGRRTIPGIEAGTRLRVTGRVVMQRRTPTIFNPAYEIVPPHAAAPPALDDE